MKNARYFYSTISIALVIFVACLMMDGPMRPGLPVAGDLFDRMSYITANITLWRLGWLCWMAAAIGLLLFALMLSTELNPGSARHYGLLLVALGITPDLIAETLYAFVMPAIPAENVTLVLLHFIDLLAMHLTGFLGNGLYNLGGLVLTIALLIQQPQLRWWLYPGVLAWLLGLGLSVAIALQQLQLAEWFTASSMVLSTVWFVVIGYKLWGRKLVQHT